MSEEIKFTKEQIDYSIHCLEHFEVLTGGRGHSKTKQIIEQLQQENQQLKSVLNEVKEYVKNELKNFERLINTSPTPSFYQLPYGVCVSILNKIEKGD